MIFMTFLNMQFVIKINFRHVFKLENNYYDTVMMLQHTFIELISRPTL